MDADGFDVAASLTPMPLDRFPRSGWVAVLLALVIISPLDDIVLAAIGAYLLTVGGVLVAAAVAAAAIVYWTDWGQQQWRRVRS